MRNDGIAFVALLRDAVDHLVDDTEGLPVDQRLAAIEARVHTMQVGMSQYAPALTALVGDYVLGRVRDRIRDSLH